MADMSDYHAVVCKNSMTHCYCTYLYTLVKLDTREPMRETQFLTEIIIEYFLSFRI